MARIKSKSEPLLRSWDEVDGALKEIAGCQLSLMEIESEMNKQINGVKQASALEAKPHQDRIDKLSKDIEVYVTEHRAEINGKTKELNFGRTGFRISTKIKYNKGIKAADVVAALLKIGRKDCVKTTQTVIADTLKKQPMETLDKVGAYLDRKDEFWLEPNIEKLQATQ
jgi:phage host-nuclease inhibitor protein Gam